MSKRSAPVSAEACVALAAGEHRLDAYPNRELNLGSLQISRALPIREHRLVGPWCFLDRFGPLTFTDGKPMDVAPHPHIGLQTVTWLHAGEVVHDDSMGVEALLRPGGVNIMTTGAACPTPSRHPVITRAASTACSCGPRCRMRIGRRARIRARGRSASRSSGRRASCRCSPGQSKATARRDRTTPASSARTCGCTPASTLEVPVDRTHEHAVLVMSGGSALDGQPLEERMLYYLGTPDRDTSLRVERHGARVLLIGGPPFPETILMWWNFVARTPEEIAEAREDWESHRRFGEVPAYNGPRLAAPRLTQLARPSPIS